MYTPKHFSETRTEVLHQLIDAQPLGTLITLQDGVLVADEVVFSLDPSAGALGTLRAHVATPCVGIEIPIERLVGKYKVSQNQPEVNRAGIIQALQDYAPDMAQAVHIRGSCA